jgi:hypothetical protein
LAQAVSDLWRVEEGGFPGCPVGTVVRFVNDGPGAHVIRADGGTVGTIHQSTTTQTTSTDGSTISLVNPSEGWRTVLTRTSDSGPAAPTAPSTTAPRVKIDPSQWSDVDWYALERAAPDVARAVRAGGRFVVYPYCISIIVLSFKRSSEVVFVEPAKRGKPVRYVLVSLVLGWWGIPWGPVWTIQSISTSLARREGRDGLHDPSAGRPGLILGLMVRGSQARPRTDCRRWSRAGASVFEKVAVRWCSSR